ncbi:MAG: alpha-glucosidase/alpha-galactosidase [Phycisphaerae bacterium]
MSSKTNQATIKIAYIGGGSKSWCRKTMTDLALCEHLTGEICLYDINYEAAARNVKLGEQIFSHPDAKTTFKVTAEKNIGDALSGADFVVISISPGPVQMFANDLDITLKHGVIHTVGDTVGPAGISRALRAVPIFEEFAREIMFHCPEAWVINYTNPMTLCTAALYAVEPHIKAFGCCHEVFGTQGWLAMMVREHRGIEGVVRQDIKIDVSGLNHFTFFTGATYEGTDVFEDVRWFMEREDFFRDRTENALERNKVGRVGSCDGLIQLDFFRRFGVVGAAGDRHLVEFVPWYNSSEDNLHRWGVSMTKSIHRLGGWNPPAEATEQKRTEKKHKPKPVKTPESLKRSKEEGVDQIMALCGIKDLDTNVNIPNVGQNPSVQLGHVVETNAAFRRDRITPMTASPLPEALQSCVERVARSQEITLDAALDRDVDLAFQAVLCDPLVTIDTDRAWNMFVELLNANRQMLPGYDIPEVG